jgi:hypothetical protein
MAVFLGECTVRGYWRRQRRVKDTRLEWRSATAILRVMQCLGTGFSRVVQVTGFVGAALGMEGCAADPVRWETEQRASAPDRASEVARPRALAAYGPMCAASVVTARARADTVYAAWWVPRADSSASLVVARSDNGGQEWNPPEVADSTDRARSGCARPPPFVAADTLSGYVHVVYFSVAPEGPGVFFTHSMASGTMFHEAVPIVYGERPSAAAVVSHGDTVAVAFEDPNAAVPQIWLALSRSTGHIFEQQTAVSSANVSATRPAVALSGPHITVSWLETARNGGPGTTVVRTGTVRW